jgi:hypothetical protein
MRIPPTEVRIAAMMRTSQMETWIPPTPTGTPMPPNSKSASYTAKCGEANHAAVYAPSA